jgi:SlyX protein
MTPDPNERITELEIQLAHLQRLHEQLDEVVIAQSTGIDRMSRQLTGLLDQVKQLKTKPSPESDSLDEKPPHY